MRFIFLDFDGVLNSLNYFRRVGQPSRWSSHDFDPDACARIMRVVEATDASIIVSSAWRIAHAMVDIRGYLEERGIPKARVIGKTPYLSGEQRGDEILSFIDTWERIDGPIEGFVIIDDSSDMSCLMHRLVRTTGLDGMEDHHIDLAIEMIMRKWDKDREVFGENLYT